MQNNLKKVGIIGACLFAMVGTGGCLTMYTLDRINEKHEKAQYEKQEDDKKVNIYKALQQKQQTVGLSSSELYDFARIHSSWAVIKWLEKEKHISQAQTETTYHNYLVQASQQGNLDAKIELINLQLLDSIPDQERMFGEYKFLKTSPIANPAKLNNGLQQALAMAKQGCQIYPLFIIENYDEQYPHRDRFGSVLDYLWQRADSQKYPDIMKNAQLLELNDELNCSKVSKSTEPPKLETFKYRFNEDNLKNPDYLVYNYTWAKLKNFSDGIDYLKPILKNYPNTNLLQQSSDLEKAYKAYFGK